MWVGGVRVILTNEKNDILMVRQHHEDRDIWMVPGGAIEDGENSVEAAVREAKEETGLDVKITGLLGIYSDRYGEDGDYYTISIQYLGEVIGGELSTSDDLTDLEWIPIGEVPLNEGFQNTKDSLRDLKKLFEGETHATN